MKDTANMMWIKKLKELNVVQTPIIYTKVWSFTLGENVMQKSL